MAKSRLMYHCTGCGATSAKWTGQCAQCGAWDTLQESLASPKVSGKAVSGRCGFAGVVSQVQSMSEVALDLMPRIPTGMVELDRVLGGGIVRGAVALIGGDPGVGKSTALLQVCSGLTDLKTLYVTGEESPQQIAMRAKRLGLAAGSMRIMAETEVETVCAAAEAEKPDVLVIDSIQTMQSAELPSSPGSVSQVRESAARLTRFAKQTGVAIFLVGHVTKTGDLAGPRVLEHMIDVVCYFEGGADSRYRMLRAIKNRYGAANELGVFAMTDKGLREIRNPSAIFLSRGSEPQAGSAVMVVWEGTRPLLVEIQALVDRSYLEHPKRVAVGLESNRLAMLLAVLSRHGGVATFEKDVFVNVVGGVKVLETSADLALLLAVVSSLRDQALPQDLAVFGEVGLAGEIRPVPNGRERLQEAAKHGFRRAIVPQANAPRERIDGIEVLAARRLDDAVRSAFGTPGRDTAGK